MVDGHCNRTVHAETNAVAHAAARGTALRGAVAYTTTFPCINCFRLLASAGIKRVVYMDDYKDPTHKSDSMMDVVNFAAEAGVPLIKYSGSRPWEDADA
jgi:dCMP deaminase